MPGLGESRLMVVGMAFHSFKGQICFYKHFSLFYLIFDFGRFGLKLLARIRAEASDQTDQILILQSDWL